MRVGYQSIFVLFLCGIMLVPGLGWAANARQLNFQLGNRGHVMAYHYKWLDLRGHPQEMTFELTKTMVREASHEFQPYNAEQARVALYRLVEAYQPKLQQKGISASVQENAQTKVPYISVSGPVPQEVLAQEGSHLAGLAQQLMQDYRTQNMYRLDDRGYLIPDYDQVVRAYTPRMRPVAAAIAANTQGLSFRQKADYVLAFLQSIPYDTLVNRRNSNGSGFATPVELITRNLGDCDSKSVAFASIMRNLYPNIPLVMILGEDHAFIGIAAQQGAGDYAIGIDGQSYVLADPVGPALAPLGDVSVQTQNILRNKSYFTIKLN